METPTPAFGARFIKQTVRWFFWFMALETGFYAGELIASAFFGEYAIVRGLIIFVTGVLGTALFGIVIGPLGGVLAAALSRKLPRRTLTIRVAWIVAICGALLGLYGEATHPHASPTTPVGAGASTPAVAASDDLTTCLDGYTSGRYGAAMTACESASAALVPRLQAMKGEHDVRVILNDGWDMLRVTYVLAFGYKQNNEPENARQMALHCAGWGILASGALATLDPKSTNPKYASMQSEVTRDMRSLNAAFPGVVAQETKAAQESH